MINLNLTPATRWGLNLVALLCAVIALRLGESVFIPTIIAVLLAGMLWPAVVWMSDRLRLPWTFSCMISVGLLVSLTVLVTMGFGLSITKMLQDVTIDPYHEETVYPRIRARMEVLLPRDLVDQVFPPEPNNSAIYQAIKQALNPEQPHLVNFLWKISAYGGNWIWQWVLIIFILLFLLLEGRMLTRKVVEIFGPSAEAQDRAVEALSDMAHQVRTYLVWRTIINFGLALVVGLVYYFLGLRQAWTWALLTAVLCYIPYIGPIAAGIPPILDAFVNCPSLWFAGGILVFYLAIITLEGYVIVPVVMGRSMEMNATTVMLACLFWDLVWGTPGLFLAMPLMAAIKAVCYHVPDMRPWANLMSDSEVKALYENKMDKEEGTVVMQEEDRPDTSEN